MGDELRKYLGRTGGSGAEADESDLDSEQFGAFCWLRGVKDRAVCLELRKKDGEILAINYGWIERFQFTPADGITLSASGQKFRIKGRNLNAEARPLFQNICRHRVLWVMETDRTANVKAGQEATVIEKIEW